MKNWVVQGLAVAMALAACTAAPPDLTEADWAAIDRPSAEVAARHARLLPGAIALVREAERQALANGRPLTDAETAKAKALGIAHPHLVRLWVTDDFPAATDPEFRDLLPTHRAAGLSFGYGMYLRPAMADQHWLLLHEFAHIAQSESLGQDAWISRYLLELLALPGNLIPLERDAIARSAVVLGTDAPAYRLPSN